MIGETAQLAVELKLKDQGFSTGIAKDEASLKRLNTTVGKTGGAFQAVAQHVGGFQKNIGKAFNDLGKGASTAVHNIEKMAFAAGALAVGGGVMAVKWAGDFQAQLNTINTIAFATPEALSKIGDGIRQVALDTGIGLDDLTSAYYDLLSAGVKAADAQSLLNNAVTLGIGGLATTTETVNLLTTAYNAYGLTAAQSTQATDMFAQAVADGKVKASEIAASFANVASIAKAYNVGINQIAASYGFLTAQGVPAAEVTTEMNRAIISLIKPLPALAKAQKDLKINFTDEIKSKGLVPALQILREYADKNKIPLIDLLGRVEAVKYALQTTGPQQAGFLAELAKINNSQGEAAKQAAARQQGLNFEIAKFKAAVHDAGIEIGTQLLPKITPVVHQLNDFFKNNRENISRFGSDLATAFENLAKWVGALNFGEIGASLKAAGMFARGLISAFLTAPQWLQTAVLTGWGLNKLTGGAVTNILGDLTKAAIGGAMQQFIARGATPANPLFVMDVSGGGLGGGLAGAAGAAGKFNPAMLIPLVAIAAAEIGVADALAGPIRDALGIPKGGTGRTQQVGPLTVRIGGSDAALFRASQQAAQPGVGGIDDRGSSQGPQRLPILRPGFVDSVRATTLSSAQLAAIFKRASAAGFHPTLASAEATNQRNLLRAAQAAAEATRKAGRDTLSELVRIRLAVAGIGTPIIYSGNTGRGTPMKHAGLTAVQQTQNQREGNITVKAVASTRDISASGTIKGRFGPTYTQAGAG